MNISVHVNVLAAVSISTPTITLVVPIEISTLNPNLGALRTRIGFGAHYTLNITRNPQNSIGNYLGPYTEA